MSNKVYGCGLTQFLGENTHEHIITPKQLNLLCGQTIKDVSAGTTLTFFLTSTGKCIALKNNSNIEYLSSLNSFWVVQVETCHRHHILRTSDGRVFTWGNNDHGQLCHGNKTRYDTPMQVEFFDNKNPYYVSCGRWVCYVCTKENNDYKLYGCGNTKYLGINRNWSACTIPVVVTSDIQWKKISTSNHTIALSADGRVFAWGYNYDGACGIPNELQWLSYPHQVDFGNTQIVDISAGGNHSLFLTNQGTVFGCGIVNGEQKPTIIPSLLQHKIIAFSAGDYHCMYVTNKGLVLSNGDNREGQAGTEETFQKNVEHNPENIFIHSKALEVKVNARIVGVACGCHHSIMWEAVGISTSFHKCSKLADCVFICVD